MNRQPKSGLNAGGQTRTTLRTIAVTSGKGGVGKTNITANLALALARKGQRVMIWDADLGLANIDILLGLNPLYNINDLFNNGLALKEIIVEGPGGVKIMPASSGIPEMSHLDHGQKMRLLDELDRYEPAPDYLLLDTGAGISSNVMYFNLAARERIVVLTPEPTSLTDAYALIKIMTTRHGEKKFKLLVNQAKNAAEAKAVFTLMASVTDRHLSSISLEYLGFIPKDENIPKAVKSQRAVLDMFPNSEASNHFILLAEKLMEAPLEPSLDGNIKFFWKKLLRA